jgi:hypothetical protein
MINDTTESIVGCTCKTTMICHLTRPLALHRRVVVICPPLSEKEKGFAQWVRKMSRLSQELAIPLLFHCDRKSRQAITGALKTKLSGSPVLYQSFKSFREWEDIPKQKLLFRADDLIAFVSARRESVSYRPFFDHVPERLEKHITGISKIMIYPAQFDSASIEEAYADVVAPKAFPFGSAVIRKIGEDASVFIKKNQLQIRKKLRKTRQRRQKDLDIPEKNPKL